MRYAIADMYDDPTIFEVLSDLGGCSLCCEVAEDGSFFDNAVVAFRSDELDFLTDSLDVAIALTVRLIQIDAEVDDQLASAADTGPIVAEIAAIDSRIDDGEDVDSEVIDRRDAIEEQLDVRRRQIRAELCRAAIAEAMGRRAAA